MEAKWIVQAAKVRGASHAITGENCQDFFAYKTSADGQWLSVAICDGAGSAPKSEIGAEYVTAEVIKGLSELVGEFNNSPPGGWVNDFLITILVKIRKDLRRIGGKDDLSDFHCTLVAGVFGPIGGITIHIGDGALFGGSYNTDTPGIAELSENFFISTPHNGEYANETFFITEPDWIKNLRIRPVRPVQWVIAGSDGGMALALESAGSPTAKFVTSLLSHVNRSISWHNAESPLDKVLKSPEANKLTSDDRTLLVAYKHLDSGPIVRELSFSPKGPRPAEVNSAVPPNPSHKQVTESSTPTAAVSKNNTDLKAFKRAPLLSLKTPTISRYVLLACFLGLLIFLLLHSYDYLRAVEWQKSIGNDNIYPRFSVVQK